MKNKQSKKFLPSWLYLSVASVFALACFDIVLFNIFNIEKESSYLSFNHKVMAATEHLKKPKQVRGIYLTAYTAGTKRLSELINFVKNNNLNAVVVDVKGPQGEPAFYLKRESLQKYNIQREIYDVDEVIEELHEKGIYAIARLFVFQDPYIVKMEPQYALQRKGGGLWADYKGVRWLDPTHFGVWRYTVDFAREAYDRGFDEVQFDYIRFPSDGNLETIEYSNWDRKTPKEVEIEKFFAYISKVLKAIKIPISADLFGLVCCYDNYDLGIGQKLSRALPYFDFISPMMYPSHYANGFIGYSNPAEAPYAVVKYSMDEANKIRDGLLIATSTPLAELRPWIQDFDIGAIYDNHKVNEQIRAVEDTNGEGFLIWNARNVYTSLTN